MAIIVLLSTTSDECGGDDGPVDDGPSAAACVCYWDADCNSGTCQYGWCELNVKNWGLCFASTELPVADSEAMADLRERLYLAFTSYEQPIHEGGGNPDPVLWAELSREGPASRWEIEIKVIVDHALTMMLGFDYQSPRLDMLAVSDRGNIRIAHPHHLAALRAMRDAMVHAIDANDPNAVGASLPRFFREHPDFQPHHSGICYPHGHAEEPYTAPLECQLDMISRILSGLNGEGAEPRSDWLTSL